MLLLSLQTESHQNQNLQNQELSEPSEWTTFHQNLQTWFRKKWFQICFCPAIPTTKHLGIRSANCSNVNVHTDGCWALMIQEWWWSFATLNTHSGRSRSLPRTDNNDCLRALHCTHQTLLCYISITNQHWHDGTPMDKFNKNIQHSLWWGEAVWWITIPFARVWAETEFEI